LYGDLEEVKPTKEDLRIFSEVITILSEASSEEPVKKSVQSNIGKIKGFQSNAEQRQALLETLGYAAGRVVPTGHMAWSGHRGRYGLDMNILKWRKN
jgi:hypothetical protein